LSACSCRHIKKGERKMSKNETATAITLFLIMAISLLAIPAAANAQSTMATYAFIGAVPNPVGVGQEVLLHVGITRQLSLDGMHWEGLSVTIQRPDGVTETIRDLKTDSTGGTGTVYVATIAGNYTLQTHFPEQVTTGTKASPGLPAGTTMLASTSEKLTLVVQEEPIVYYPGHPLPIEYWTRPIDAQLREWHTISGNWLVPTPILPNDNLYAPYNDYAPESAHILWTRPIGDTMGGLAGGTLGEHSYGTGDAYEGKMGGAIIIGGVFYYNKFDSGQPQQEVVAVDIHTGEELWTKTLFDNRRISFGQVLYWTCLNYHGAFSYLWVTVGTTWHAFEALTGEWRYNMTNVPGGSNVYGPHGEILRYTVNSANGWMTQWNTSTVVVQGKVGMATSWGSQTRGVTYNATERGYDWNVTIPTGLPGSVRATMPNNRIIGASITETEVTIWGLSLVPGEQGRLLFSKTWKAPSEWAAGNQTISWAAANIEDGVAVLYSKERNHYFGFSLETGEFLWGPSQPENYLNIYDRISTINYGTLVSSGASGIVYGYNAQTGELLWTYDATDPYSEILWANNWWLQQLIVADGKVYLGHGEHSPIDPRPRGAPFVCLDVETGEEIWRLDGEEKQQSEIA
jgi:outer membrane protein assembly factor BamB